MKENTRLQSYHDLIASIVAAIEARDLYTADHSQRVATMSETIGLFLRLQSEQQTTLHIAAHLHDIGKLGIDDAVLRKTGPLNDREWTDIRRHSVIGWEILRKVDSFAEIAVIVRHHHERWDGGGYPDGIAGERIPLAARIIAVADSIDAMLSRRSYRAGMPISKCRGEIERNTGTMYDPEIVSVVLSHWGEIVVPVEKLNTHAAGEKTAQ